MQEIIEKEHENSNTFDSKKSLEQAVERLLGEVKKEEIVEIPIDKIMANRFQPRKYFSKSGLEDLASSIKENGVLQPITVRKINDESIPYSFELITGERRLKATRIAGLSSIPAVIREKTDSEIKKLALIENLQREDITYFETMQSIRSLKDEYNDNEIIAKEIGISRRSVEHYLKCYTEISSIKEIFQIVEKGQENLKRKDLVLIASVMPELRKFQKSNKTMLERFIKKSLKKGIVTAAESLLKKLEEKDKNNEKNSFENNVLDIMNSPISYENNGKLIFKITIEKGQPISHEKIEEMKLEFSKFISHLTTNALEEN